MRDCVWAATAALPPRPLPPTWSACAAARWGMTGKALCPAGQRIRMAVCRCAHLAAWQTRQATRCFKSALANRPSMLVRSLAKQCFTSVCAPCHTAGCGRAAAAQASVPGCVAPLGGKGHLGYQDEAPAALLAAMLLLKGSIQTTCDAVLAIMACRNRAQPFHTHPGCRNCQGRTCCRHQR